MKILTPGHCYELDQFEPIPARKPLKGLASDAYRLCQLIEACGCGEAQTNAVVAAAELMNKLLDQIYGPQVLQFIEKRPATQSEAATTGQLVTVNNGTTNEEVLKVLINRLHYLNEKFPCRENALAITKTQEALMWLNQRTASRIARGVEGKHLA